MSRAKKKAAPAVGPLRLVCIGDTHGFHRRLVLPPGDILIHAGDFDGRSVEAVDDFNLWLGSLPFRHRIVIAGNHDTLFDWKPKLARAHLTEATYLQDSGIHLEGLNFWGSPVNSVMGEDWAFSRERGAAIRKHWDRIPADTDVLITHKAPYGTLDKNHILAKHGGCQNLLFGSSQGSMSSATSTASTAAMCHRQLKLPHFAALPAVEFGPGPDRDGGSFVLRRVVSAVFAGSDFCD